MSDEPWRWSASALVNAIQDRTLSSREAVQAHLDRMDAINGAVNAVTAVLAEEALAAADRADRRVASGDPVGPLHGLPVKRLSLLTPDRRAKLTPLSGTAEVVPVVK